MADMPPAHFRWDLVDGVAVVEILSREINQPHLAEELGAQLHALLRTGASKHILLDFHKTRFMSSTAFATLLNFAKQVAEIGGQARICAMDPDVRIGADILGIARFLPIHDTEASALAAFAQERAAG